MANDLTGTVTYASGKFSQARATGHAETSNLMSLATTALTIEGWLLRASGVNTTLTNVWIGQGGAFFIATQQNTGFAEFAVSGGSHIFGSTNLADGLYHHWAVTWDSAGCRAFIDGVCIGSDSTPYSRYTSTTDLMSVGQFGTGASLDGWSGQIDEVAIYNLAKYTTTASFTPPAAPISNSASGLLALYHLDGDLVNNAGAAATVPGAPTIGTATAGNGVVVVNGTAPASNGGATIAGYTATGSLGHTASNATLPVTVTGTAGSAETFTLHATNSVGNSSESSASNSVTPYSVTGVTVSPSTATVNGGLSQTFTATVAGTASPPQGVTWSTSGGSITSGGVLTAPTATSSIQTVTVTANSVAYGPASGTATVTVPATASTVSGVTVTPSTATIAGGTTQAFSATVAGSSSPSQTVNWSTSAGSINSSGVLTAPASTGGIQTVTVTATSAQDGTKAGTATVTVPATSSATFTQLSPMKNIMGGLRLGIAVRATVSNKDTDAVIGTATGLTTHATTGVVPPFSVAGTVAATTYTVKVTNIADAADYAVFNMAPA